MKNLFCSCGRIVEDIGTDVKSVVCSYCIQKQTYFPQLLIPIEPKEIGMNEFYLVVSNGGSIFKTKFQAEFNVVLKWAGVIFGEKVKNNYFLCYRIGGTIHNKKISTIPISEPYSNKMFFDFNNLDLHGGIFINDCWVENHTGRLKL